MIIRLHCPQCKNDAYTSSVEEYRVCPYCGLIYSGKYGIDRRKEKRIEKRIPIRLTCLESKANAYSTNMSNEGMCIKIIGGFRINKGDILNLKFNNLNVKAKIMWLKDFSKIGYILAGLKLE